MKHALLLLVLACLAAVATHAHAHKPSDSYLTLKVEGARIDGQWDIALRDLDFAIGLDANQDGEITWGEVRAKLSEIDAYAFAHLAVGPARAPCTTTVGDHLVDEHTDGAYIVLRFASTCGGVAPRALEVAYRLFFDIDPQHRGLLNLQAPGYSRAAVFSVDAPSQTFKLTETSRLDQFLDYGREGVVHIWTGFDHILFLVALLLPSVLVRTPPPAARWQPAPDFRRVFIDVLKVVTAFTVAHSITLSLAALGVVSLPSRFVDSCVAASVVFAALNNIRPIAVERRWIIAFGFGLLHGFGFATVLLDLGLPRGTLLLALVGFNLGVEAGQLVIVSAFLPVAYLLRETFVYRRIVFIGGSALIALLALGWFIERAFNIRLFG